MGTDFWRNKYAGLAERAVTELGVNGIYMDQACTSLACYDPQHGHPVGGGIYWMQAFALLESDIRRRCAAPPRARRPRRRRLRRDVAALPRPDAQPPGEPGTLRRPRRLGHHSLLPGRLPSVLPSPTATTPP